MSTLHITQFKQVGPSFREGVVSLANEPAHSDTTLTFAAALTSPVFEGTTIAVGIRSATACHIRFGTIGSDFVMNGAFAADKHWTKGTGWTIGSGVASSDASQGADSDLTQTPTIELLANGAFASDTLWTKGTGWTIAAGIASSSAAQTADSDLTQTPSTALVEGQSYRVTFTVSGRTVGSIAPVIGDTEGTDRSGNGTYIEDIIAGSGADIDFRADVDFDGDIDNASVQRLLVNEKGELYLPSVALVEGNLYRVTFTVSSYVAGNVTAVVGGTEGTDRAADGTFIESIIAGSSADIDIRADLDFNGSVDALTVEEVPNASTSAFLLPANELAWREVTPGSQLAVSAIDAA